MAVLAKSDWAQLDELWKQAGLCPEYELIRGPEVGLVMARGRIGGSGRPFNVGEVTVARCSIRLTKSHAIGHAYVIGRNGRHAQTAALIDGIMQSECMRPRLERDVIGPLRRVYAARRSQALSKAAATKVDFFTLVRGEDD